MIACLNKMSFYMSLLILSMIIIFTLSIAEADSDNTRQWKKRINECKEILGSKYKKNNGLNSILVCGIEHQIFGPTCRVKDLSSKEKRNQFKNAWAEFKKKEDINVKYMSCLVGCSYLNATDFFILFDRTEFRKLMPEHFEKAVVDLKFACKSGFCHNEKKSHGTFWVNSGCEGTVSLGVPTDNMDTHLGFRYYWLIDSTNADKIKEIVDNFKKK